MSETEFDASDPPGDVFGFTIKAGHVVSYAVTQGRSAVMRFALVITPPYRNKRGVWKIRVRGVYSPQSSYHCNLIPDDARNTVLDAIMRVCIHDYDKEGIIDRAKIVNAERRLLGDNR